MPYPCSPSPLPLPVPGICYCQNILVDRDALEWAHSRSQDGYFSGGVPEGPASRGRWRLTASGCVESAPM